MGRERVFLSQVIPFTEQKKEYLLYENHQSGLISFASPERLILIDLIRLKCLDLPDIDFDLNIMTVDDYFRQFYK